MTPLAGLNESRDSLKGMIKSTGPALRKAGAFVFVETKKTSRGHVPSVPIGILPIIHQALSAPSW